MRERKCLECHLPLKGRSDKRFCSDQCRSTFHNRCNQEENQTFQDINRILKTNRKILLRLCPAGVREVPLKQLREMGFSFEYLTHIKIKSGKKILYCYDQGYSTKGRIAVIYSSGCLPSSSMYRDQVS